VKLGDVLAERFELLSFASEGGMGAVFRALDRQTGEIVALKHVRATRDGEARFFREARALALLKHPAIVRYVAHGTTQAGEPYLAMEWLEGETLRERLGRGPLGVQDSIDLARRIAGALAHAHGRRVIHRDLNPSNLLLLDGRIEGVKLLDFGLARHLGDRTETTGTFEGPMGTMGYMAPEQARGNDEVDARADLFSLGAVLFECVTGRAPFAADNYLAALAKIVVARAPRLRDVTPEAPSQLDALVAQLLAKDVDERPTDADAVIDALNAMGGSRPSLRAPLPSDSLALGNVERALVSVILVRPPEGTDRSFAERARAVGARYGFGSERLADGTYVLVGAGTGAATDQVRRAARAALALRSESEGLALSLATGWAVVAGALPDGDLVERAASLLATAAPGAIHIDDVTLGLMPARFEVCRSGPSPALESERADHTPVRRLLGRHTHCVGRERELRTLHAIVNECVSAPLAQAVLLTGPAGVGKSRVRYELIEQLSERHPELEVWLGRGDPMSAGSPYHVLGQALRQALGSSERTAGPVQREELAERVARNVSQAARERVTEFLAELIGVSPSDDGSLALQAARRDPLLMGDQIRQALLDFLAAECRAHPVLLVLEDFQWGDAATARLLDAALRHSAEQPLAVIAVARPDVHELFPGLWAERGVQEIRVGALTRRAAETLVREALGTVDETTLSELVQRAGGNAFYLEELIRAHVEGRTSLPDTVLGMVKERIESMEPEARRVLRAASVFGQSFWPNGITALLGGAAMSSEVAAWLDTLEQREVVSRRSQSRLPGEREYTFRHSLVREAAYAMLSDADRALGHRLAAEHLERVGMTDPVQMAEHFERGGAADRAVVWWHAAARSALDANDFEAAIANAQRGRRATRDPREQAQLDLSCAEAMRHRGDAEKALELVERARGSLEPSSLAGCNAAGELALLYQRLGRARELGELADELLRQAPDPETADALALACMRTAQALLRVGARERADRLAELAQSASSLPGPVTLAQFHWFYALSALLDGKPGVYLDQARKALSQFEQIGNDRAAVEQRINIAGVCVELGAFAEAERLLHEALAKAERLGLPHSVGGARLHLGLAAAYSGRIEEGIELELLAQATFHERDRRLEGCALLSLAMILALQGQTERAREEAERALSLLEGAAPPLVPAVLATLADVRSKMGDHAAALELSERAYAALSSRGSVEFGEYLIRRVRAEVLHRSGAAEPAREVVREAKRRLLEQAERLADPDLHASFLGNVPDHARILALAERWQVD
jgi:tetratricopeptide (TPR) repeat protein